MPTALIVLADGFEEIEAASLIDILRRAGVDVTIAGLVSEKASSTRDMVVQCEGPLNQFQSTFFDALILPGGEPGASSLSENKQLISLIKTHNAQGKIVAAICAAPKALLEANILSNKTVTSHPSIKDFFDSAHYKEDAVVQDGNIVTSRGPGTAMAFAYHLASLLTTEPRVSLMKKAMLYKA
jgi:protein deglycase